MYYSVHMAMDPDTHYGLLYNYDVASKGWPGEVDERMQSDRPRRVNLFSGPSTLWRLPDDCPESLKKTEPTFCWQSQFVIATPKAAFATFKCSASLDELEDLGQCLHSEHGQSIAPCFRACYEAVFNKYLQDKTTLQELTEAASGT